MPLGVLDKTRSTGNLNLTTEGPSNALLHGTAKWASRWVRFPSHRGLVEALEIWVSWFQAWSGIGESEVFYFRIDFQRNQEKTAPRAITRNSNPSAAKVCQIPTVAPPGRIRPPCTRQSRNSNFEWSPWEDILGSLWTYVQNQKSLVLHLVSSVFLENQLFG